MKPKHDPKSYADLVSSIRIDHDEYAAIRERLDEAFADIGRTPTPTCLHLVGETRTGKSCVVHEFLRSQPWQRHADGEKRSVVYAIAPAKATVKSLLECLLKGLGDPYWSRGTESNMQGRLHTLLEAVACRMIVIDEFQHLCDKGQNKKLQLTSDFLKNLLEPNRWGLVAVGLPSSSSVINTNPQLYGRFDATLTMPLFRWSDKVMQAQFRAILAAFQKQLAPFQFPKLSHPENALRLYLATTGRLGLLAKLMDRAVRQAVRRKSFEIGLPELQRAFNSAIWFAPRFPLAGGPFGAALELANAELFDRINALAAVEMYEDNSAQVTVTTVGADAEGKSIPGTGSGREAKPPRGAKVQHKTKIEKVF